jgi:hypothetical protein
MRGSLWTLIAAGIGSGLFLWAAVGAARPDNPASSTQATAQVLSEIAPFAGLVLFVGAIGVLLVIAFRTV